MNMNNLATALIAVMILVGGPTATRAETPAQVAANKKLVLEFSRQVFDAHDVSKAKAFLADDTIEHNPNVPSGLKGFVDTFGMIWQPRAAGEKAPSADAELMQMMEKPPVAVIAEGDKVLVVLKLKRPDPTAPGKTYESFWFDLYRIKDHKVAEHWDGALKELRP